MPVVTLVRPGSVEIEADVPAERAGEIAVGLEVRIETADGRVLPARVRSMSPALDPQSRRARVKLDFLEGVAPTPAAGSYVRVGVPGRDTEGVWVPADALVSRGQLVGLYLIEDDHLRLRWVRVGQRSGDDEGLVEILAGLRPGDLVVRRPAAGLVDGAPVGSVRRVDPAGGSEADGAEVSR
jgi:multidrug efflux pump subunit AcrA (membrane-fusion protein)